MLEVVATLLWLDLFPLHPGLDSKILLLFGSGLGEQKLNPLWLDLVPLHPGLASLVSSHLAAVLEIARILSTLRAVFLPSTLAATSQASSSGICFH